MSNREIIIRPVENEKELNQMYYVRWFVLRKPLGKDRGTERDRYEKESFHLIAIYNNRVIGCARFRELSEKLGGISYVAVLPEFRQQGIGTKMIEKIIEKAKKEKFTILQLNSRLYAANFYKKFGFSEAGTPRYLLGIIHVAMRMKL